MVRAPCCEKMGLKKGPWTIEEDQILISYIQRCGHGNWRALPKQAGLLRCGKSCRLRWTNYLRPDIKRGNFTIEEEESIIKLHEMLGNRWSTIAARLPGRTDNEIKNVWHTHLKKRRAKNQASPDTKLHYSIEISKSSDINKARESDPMNFATNPIFENSGSDLSVSPQRSSSHISSGTDSSIVASENHSMGIEDERTIDSSSEVEVLPDINEDFWTEAFSTEISSMPEDFPSFTAHPQLQFPFYSVPTAEPIGTYSSNIEEGMDFWYNVFIKAGELPDLQEF